ncbi:hypothetical protein B296_00027284 [Ensete ventricosum]|uniref:Phosphoglycerate kinase n=1 Tax=Ensete ventricosum TaxID=4639 RepID=A0A427APY7_ENSVE|nr:hypothetical protein B296_00027284 [Ensete ventricosum]
MASTAATSFSLLPTSSRRRSLTAAPPLSGAAALRSPLRRLGFAGAAADPLLVVHVAAKIRSVAGRSWRGSRGVASMAKKSVGDLTAADLKGKKVFVRADLNVPLDENRNITDDTRIRAAVPTIKHLISNGAKVILSSHLVRCSLHNCIVLFYYEFLYDKQVEKADDCIGPEVENLVNALPEGGVLLLENVRFYKEEEKNDPEFAKKLAALADLYVNDAFGTAHRAHASTEGVTKFLKPSVAGFLLQKELDYLVGAVSTPKRPFAAIVGGSKVSSKIGVIESLLEKCDILLLGGGMIFTFYKAQDKFAADAESKLIVLTWQSIAKKLAELSGKGVTTIIGGGDSVAAVEKVGVADAMSHISTGGGASLELLEGKELPGVVALDEAVAVAV